MPQPAAQRTQEPVQSRASRRFDPGRLWAYARRETMELLRDPIRLAFAFVGPVILMLAIRLWHHVRCREPEICGLRPGPDAGKPQAARKLLGLSLFLRTASDRVSRRNWSNACGAESWLSSLKFHPASAAILQACIRPRSASGSTPPCRSAARRRKDTSPALVLRYVQDLAVRALWP